LIDIWAPQDNYKDYANVPQERHDDFMAQAMLQLEQYQAKTVWLKTTTVAAAKLITEPLDYVYVDARHDYCGVLEDIRTYWPLIRPGGIMAGEPSGPCTGSGSVTNVVYYHGTRSCRGGTILVSFSSAEEHVAPCPVLS
jgi:hypothetical protein